MLAYSRRTLAVVLSLSIVAPTFVVLEPTTAEAQPKRKPVRDQLPPDARPKWDAAVALFKAQQWDTARATFLSLYESTHNPRVLINAGVCEKNLQHYPAAIASFKRALDEGKSVLSADEIAEINTLIDGLKSFVAQAVVVVNEPDATVYVDDEKVTGPLTGPLTLNSGARKFRATKPGFADATETADLRPDVVRTVTLKLSPLRKTARVKIAVTGPKSAEVFIGNKRVGATDATGTYVGDVEISPEPIEFRVEAPDFVTARESRLLREGEATTLNIQMAEEAKKGKLIVVTNPADGVISIDGDIKGSSRWEGPVDTGRHTVTVKKQGYYQWNLDVDVPRNAERFVTASLNEDRNSNFVPWLIGTVLVVGGTVAAVALLAQPKDQEPVNGSLAPFTVGTPAWRIR
jgi:hypothetical protein